MSPPLNPERANTPNFGPRIFFDGTFAGSIKRAAKIAGVSRTFIYNEINAGRLRRIKKGRRSLILMEDLLAWLRNEPGAS